jgi:hypothetical protein
MWRSSPLAVIDGVPATSSETSLPWQFESEHDFEAVCWDGGIP